MINFPTSTMPPTGEHWIPPCNSTNNGSDESLTPPGASDSIVPPGFHNFSVVPPPISTPSPHYNPIPHINQQGIVEPPPALFPVLPYHSLPRPIAPRPIPAVGVRPVQPMATRPVTVIGTRPVPPSSGMSIHAVAARPIPIITARQIPTITARPIPTIAPRPIPTIAPPSIPTVPIALDPHKINEAESLKFINDNDMALKKSRRRSNSRDYSKGESRGNGADASRGRVGWKEKRSLSRTRYRSRSKGRSPDRAGSNSRSQAHVMGPKRRRSRSRSADPGRSSGSSNHRFRDERRSRDRGRSRTPRRSGGKEENRSESRDSKCSRVINNRSPGRNRRDISPRRHSTSSLNRVKSPSRPNSETPRQGPAHRIDSAKATPEPRYDKRPIDIAKLPPDPRYEKRPIDTPKVALDPRYDKRLIDQAKVAPDARYDKRPIDAAKAPDPRYDKRPMDAGKPLDSRYEKRTGPGNEYIHPGNKGYRKSYQPNSLTNGAAKNLEGNRRGGGGYKRGVNFRSHYNGNSSGPSNYNGSKDKDTTKARQEEPEKDYASLVAEKKSDSDDEIIEEWVRSAPSELYYSRGENGDMYATDRSKQLCKKFYANLVLVAKDKRLEAENLGAEHTAKLIEDDKKEMLLKKCNKAQSKCSKSNNSSSESDDSLTDDSDSEENSTRSDTSNKELERRKKHPRRIHTELWHNEPGHMNDGPVCRCSAKARRFGIRHGFYPGENFQNLCDPYSNNESKLYHYKILINPATNLVIRSPTVISHDSHEYIFEGFSIFSHYKLDEKLPPCRVIRFNIRYCMAVASEKFPQNFCVQDLKLFETYVFREILELVDLKYDPAEEVEEGYCSQFHLMPRFARQLPDNGKEILSMDKVLQHLLKSDKELIEESELKKYLSVDQSAWQDFADKHKGTIVMKRGMKPCAIRVDQIDRNVECQGDDDAGIPFPLIVHFGIRPPQLSYAGNVEYQRAWRRFVKYRHLLSNMPKPKIEDKRKLMEKDLKLQEMRTRSTMKRDVTVDISAKGFRTTGICCDLVQHAMLIPVLFAHMRFHKSLDELEKQMSYDFKNRYLLQLAMTHPSYRENFGTNPDHARNALTNCGIRQPEYGDRSIHYASSRKRGINTLIDIMARFGMKYETESEITHNERLEFLGDAVVEFVTSIHLFHIFPDLEEGGLATYRAAIVQNQHLAVLAQNLGLDRFMLYAHGSDLCHDSELRHAMANCFEALMGALFLDGGLEIADTVFANTMYGSESQVLDVWVNYPRHPLQMEEPNGDRHWIQSHVALQKLAKFEDDTGIEFRHVRLLARAFTDRSLGYNNLSRGSNQRLEFLGDTVLQLIASEYLYRHFPDHHEGHLSLLRSSLVNNRTQAKVCDILGMAQYSMRHDPKSELKTKDRADLLEAFLGALYIDQGLESCVVFCSVCFFPRLTESIINQDWNDPKSKLQQCCLTLRSMDGKEPEIPTYKVTEVMGPTNTRVYKVAVYFKNKRLATSRGHSIQEAEMNAASNALVKRDYLFPQLKHQKRLLEKSTKKITDSQLVEPEGTA